MSVKTSKRIHAGNVQMTSPTKVAHHAEKLGDFLAGKPVFPVTVEMDITTDCPLNCRDCPSTRGPSARNFALADIDRFFGRLEGQTRGLLLSGGEPTSSPDFPAFLKLARARGFEEIAVVSNGSLLDDEAVIAALLEDATVVRLSLYDWEREMLLGKESVLSRIDALRRRIDATGSSLHIGVSALTASDRAAQLGPAARAVADSGAHWIYFHPICTGWGTGSLSRTDQRGVSERIQGLEKDLGEDFGVFYCPSRYHDGELRFDEYYSAHFLMVVGADGINYLGTETKYQPEYAIADTAAVSDGFLSEPERLRRIRSYNQGNYPPLGGRHRGLLYNDHIERLKRGTAEASRADDENGRGPADDRADPGYLYPHIL